MSTRQTRMDILKNHKQKKWTSEHFGPGWSQTESFLYASVLHYSSDVKDAPALVTISLKRQDRHHFTSQADLLSLRAERKRLRSVIIVLVILLLFNSIQTGLLYFWTWAATTVDFALNCIWLAAQLIRVVEVVFLFISTLCM